MGSCFSSPEAQPYKPPASSTNPSAGPSANNRTNGPAVQMSNAAGATLATQTTTTNQKHGQAAGESNRPAVPADPLDGDEGPDTANPITDNDFTSALNSAPEPTFSANVTGQPAVVAPAVAKEVQPARAQRDRSYAIDKLIEEDSKKFKKECKILLLGGSPLREKLAPDQVSSSHARAR
jgi:hypothetical protein